MPKLLIVLFLCVNGFNAASQSIKAELKFNSREIVIRNDDVITTANVFIQQKKVKTKEFKIYTWYSNNNIMTTKGGFSGELLHGEYLVKYADKNLKTKGEFKHGLKHKKWIHWNDFGGYESIYHYRNGILDGPYKEYNENGVLVESGQYVNGELHGIIRKYENGVLVSETLYRYGENMVERKRLKQKEKELKKKEKEKQSKPAPSETEIPEFSLKG